MTPLLWALTAIGTGVAGYFRYEQIKPNDLVQIKTDELPNVTSTMKVTAINGDSVTGSIIADIGGISQDTRVPLTVHKRNVIKNLSPRLW